MAQEEWDELKAAKEAWEKDAKKLESEVEALKLAQDKLERSVNQWGDTAVKNFCLQVLIHENIRQPVASPVGSWRAWCGRPYGASSFSSGYGKNKVRSACSQASREAMRC